ncbi:DNA cytosine methyltransferase [Verrucomicrobia bacterium]|nr:DNA cytosine methyltransferase [Verrucomicrobiota bacterium]
MKKKLKFVDLFAGAGGLSLGFKQARRDNGETAFEAGALIDNFEAAKQTYQKNNKSAPYHICDISTISADEIRKLAGLRKNQRLDLLMGGPPCQGFSTLNQKARSKNKTFNDFIKDKGNKLLKTFLDLASQLQPKFILMENVPNMIRCADKAYLKEIQKIFDEDGEYTICIKVLNAIEFGVPQLRKRAFLVAVHHDVLNNSGAEVTNNIIRELESSDRKNKDFDYYLPKEKFQIVGNGQELMSAKSKNGYFAWHVSVKEAIDDLPSLKAGQTSVIYAKDPSTDYQLDLRNGNERVFNHEARSHSAEMQQKMNKIKPGEGNRHLESRDRFENNGGSKAKVDYLSQAYGRLHPKGPAYTITCNFQNPGSGFFTHYKDNRTITVREAARLQSFPDDYYFCGNMAEQTTQVGNAVPPLLAKEIAEHLINIFKL